MIPLSEATAIAVHAMIFLTHAPQGACSLKTIAAALDVSENHLSKVLQKLVKAGFVVSEKGSRGGYSIRPEKRAAALMEIYEVIEGPWAPKTCLFNGRRGRPCCCLMHGLLGRLNKTFEDFMTEQTIDRLALPPHADSAEGAPQTAPIEFRGRTCEKKSAKTDAQH